MDASGNKHIRVAVLYICTGRYSRFFAGFYESAKKHLLRGIAEVEYFVFTDDTTLTTGDDVHIIERQCKGFPADTLGRFEMFLSMRSQLEAFDYIFFLNSNALLVKDVGTEILPDSETGLTAARWVKQKPMDWPMFYPYERRRQSTAHIPPFDGPYAYYMGGFNGGTAKAYLAMAEQLNQNIKADTGKGILARYHDQAYLNHYLHKRPLQELPKGYCCPEEWLTEAFDTHIMFREKVHIDTYFNKGRNHSPWGRVRQGANALWQALKWYL